MAVEIYVDGSCIGNPGPGGWGVYIPDLENPISLCGGAPRTTNNRMEMQAAIEALQIMPQESDIIILSDSRLLVEGMSDWIHGWIAQGRLESTSSKPVANADLWKILLSEAAWHTVKWKWVKGHAGNHGNEIADKLANSGSSGRRIDHAKAPRTSTSKAHGSCFNNSEVAAGGSLWLFGETGAV